MNATICSIKTEEIIAPGSELSWAFDSGHYGCFEIHGPLELKSRKRREVVECGCIVVGNKFKLLNHNLRAVSVRGVVLNSGTVSPFNQLDIFKGNQYLDELFVNAFAHHNSPSETFHRFETILPSLLSIISDKENETAQGKKEASGKIDRRLIKIHRYIRNNYHLTLSLQHLAELIECNPIYLSNTYSKVFQISPMKHLQMIRMEKAKFLLSSTNTTIKDIANQLGYISSSQFADLFKRYHRLTPSQYRLEFNLNEFD
ncbi:helix-turn-helix transcriptional regulator [Paenibacillus sp. NPDC058071]|uniref:helix-turn-helix transcriptional regulator n=1 Tax=Paenibacillus sp. NPDC058071 TaxID=3346326 RepID=UPI0036D98531